MPLLSLWFHSCQAFGMLEKGSDNKIEVGCIAWMFPNQLSNSRFLGRSSVTVKSISPLVLLSLGFTAAYRLAGLNWDQTAGESK